MKDFWRAHVLLLTQQADAADDRGDYAWAALCRAEALEASLLALES